MRTVFGFCAWRRGWSLRALLVRAALATGLTAATLLGVQAAASAAPDASGHVEQAQEQPETPPGSNRSDDGQCLPVPTETTDRDELVTAHHAVQPEPTQHFRLNASDLEPSESAPNSPQDSVLLAAGSPFVQDTNSPPSQTGDRTAVDARSPAPSARDASWASPSTSASSVVFTGTAANALGVLPAYLTAPTAGPAHAGFGDATALIGTITTEPSVSPD